MRLSELAIGKDAVIEKVETRDVSLRKHILEMGLTPGVEVRPHRAEGQRLQPHAAQERG